MWVWLDQIWLIVTKQPTDWHQTLIQMLLNPDPPAATQSVVKYCVCRQSRQHQSSLYCITNSTTMHHSTCIMPQKSYNFTQPWGTPCDSDMFKMSVMKSACWIFIYTWSRGFFPLVGLWTCWWNFSRKVLRFVCTSYIKKYNPVVTLVKILIYKLVDFFYYEREKKIMI